MSERGNEQERVHKRDNASVCIAPGEIQRGRAGERESRREGGQTGQERESEIKNKNTI